MTWDFKKLFSYCPNPKVRARAVAEATEPLMARTAVGLRLHPPCPSSGLCLWNMIMSPPSTGQREASVHVHIPDMLNCHSWECSRSSHQLGKENQSNWKSIISAAFTQSSALSGHGLCACHRINRSLDQTTQSASLQYQRTMEGSAGQMRPHHKARKTHVCIDMWK